MLKKGILIAFVGVDGAGKTTHSKLLFKHVSNYIMSVELVKAYNKEDSSILKKYKNKWDDVSLTLFFQILHRFQNNKAEEILNKNGLVIADKWNEAYFAYHNHFGFLSHDSRLRNSLNVITFSQRKPDLCFYVRVTPEILESRLYKRKNKKISDISALNNLELLFNFFERESRKNKWVIIDGSRSIKENSLIIRKNVDDYIASL